jgi:PAS domain S-box-containing protein
VHLKASEARLRESEEKYRFIFDHAPTPIFVIDADDMRILDVNARAEEEYQYTREELLNMSFADLGLDRDRELTASRLQQLYSTDVTLLPVMQHRRRDESIFMVNYQTCLSSYRNRPAVIAAVWDVTERLEKHARLIQAGKMATLGEMATGIAHELNQPLNVVRLGCDYLNKKLKACHQVSIDDLSQVTAELSGSVARASKIINHLRQFGRKADDTMTPIDINVPIRNVFNLLGSQLDAHGIGWHLELADHLPQIVGDSIRLEQVFINLILNAKDAILKQERDFPAQRKEKTVTIRSFTEDDRLVVTVKDTGPGVPESTRNKVFEPFFTTKKTGEGTGLGLSISYGIIKEHNGTIEIVAEQKQGATFRLTFPALKTETNR